MFSAQRVRIPLSGANGPPYSLHLYQNDDAFAFLLTVVALSFAFFSLSCCCLRVKTYCYAPAVVHRVRDSNIECQHAANSLISLQARSNRHKPPLLSHGAKRSGSVSACVLCQRTLNRLFMISIFILPAKPIKCVRRLFHSRRCACVLVC